MSDEPRQTGKKTVLVALHYITSAELARDMIPAIEEGGLFVRTDGPLAVGAEVDLSITIGDLGSIRQRGRVTWIRGLAEGGMAVRLVHPVEPKLAGILKIALT